MLQMLYVLCFRVLLEMVLGMNQSTKWDLKKKPGMKAMVCLYKLGKGESPTLYIQVDAPVSILIKRYICMKF
jgi:hypothetical protein